MEPDISSGRWLLKYPLDELTTNLHIDLADNLRNDTVRLRAFTNILAICTEDDYSKRYFLWRPLKNLSPLNSALALRRLEVDRLTIMPPNAKEPALGMVRDAPDDEADHNDSEKPRADGDDDVDWLLEPTVLGHLNPPVGCALATPQSLPKGSVSNRRRGTGN